MLLMVVFEVCPDRTKPFTKFASHQRFSTCIGSVLPVWVSFKGYKAIRMALIYYTIALTVHIGSASSSDLTACRASDWVH